LPPRILAIEEDEVCARISKLDTFAPSLVRQAELELKQKAKVAVDAWIKELERARLWATVR